MYNNFQNPSCPLQASEGPPEPVDGRRHGELQQPRVPSLRRLRPGPVRQPLLLLQVPAAAQPAVLETMSSILLRLNKPCNYYSCDTSPDDGGRGGVIIPQGKRERQKAKGKGKRERQKENCNNTISPHDSRQPAAWRGNYPTRQKGEAKGKGKRKREKAKGKL